MDSRLLGLSGCEFHDRVFQVMNFRVFRVSYYQVVNLIIESGGMQTPRQPPHRLVWAQVVMCPWPFLGVISVIGSFRL